MSFKDVLIEQKQELESLKDLIERDQLAEALDLLKYPNAIVVCGVRRCGKSIFCYELVRGKKFGYINFDDERLFSIKTSDLNGLLQTVYEVYGEIDYLVLDEVQNVLGWELFVNRLRRTKKVIVTGSNANLLKGDLATKLTGRHIPLTMHPFSFKEFLKYNGIDYTISPTTLDKAKILTKLEEYLTLGGFPEVYKFGKKMAVQIYEDILTKDVLARSKTRKPYSLKNLCLFLVSNAGSEITFSRLAKNVETKDAHTSSKWFSMLEDSFLVFKIERFDFKLKKQFLAPKKVYCIDTGIIDSVGFKVLNNFTKSMENLVAIELQRKKANDPTIEIFYWKNRKQHEVDFLIKSGEKIIELIQVTYANSKEEIRERETRSLIEASSELKCKKLTIITWNLELEFDGIKYIPLWKWLLN